MKVFTKTAIALALAAAFANAAYAQTSGSGGGEPWVLKENMGYVIGKDGKAMIIDLPKLDAKMKKKESSVPKDTVFFMKGGTLMMADWPSGH